MIHLRIRTEYSFGQTYAPIKRVIQRLKDIGCTAAGIVDVSTWGHVKWHKACKEAGIQPMLGVELFVTDDNEQTKMWFLAKNQAGLKELYNWNSIAYRQPINAKTKYNARLYKPEVETMAKSNNIVIFSGDVLDGEFLKDVNAVVDLNPSSRILNFSKMQLADKYGLRVVSTADNAYVYDDDVDVFEIMVPGGRKQTDQTIPETLEHQEQAEMIALQCADLELNKAPMVHEKGDLESICRQGIEYRKMAWNEQYEERLQYELKLIREKDFDSYFIIVSDMTQYAKKHMLVGPSRGSAAGSLVCYTSRITEIDPIPPGLYFERFIDVSRKDLPDIDLDFPDAKRHIVFDYMAEKYGRTNVAHIGTVSYYKPKSALIAVCKELGIPPQATFNVKTAMIERSIADARASNCLEDTFNETEPGRQFIKSYPSAIIAKELEGHASHVGVHAAGLLVCSDKITDYATVDNEGIAHLDKYDAEYVNLLKIDVLGLRTLSVLEDAGVPIDWYNLPLDDKNVFDNIFNKARLCGIFQFEGNAMRSLTKLVEIKSIIEVDNVTALARPGPYGAGIVYKYIDRKKGLPYESIHPLVEECMRETFGLPMYQEQTFTIVRNIGKFNWEETTFIRKGISKRMGQEFFAKFYPRFIQGAVEQGIPEHKAAETWKLINAMGSWQMNKAHTYSYAVISYWCAYLKLYHTLEFAASTLRNAKDDDQTLELLRELSKEGIEFVPFDINLSEENWCVKGGKLIGGFSSLKGIGEVQAKKFVKLRDEGKLTAKDIDKINSKESVFNNIFPFHTDYADIYENPDKYNIGGKVIDIVDIDDSIPHKGERVFLAELVHKNPRDINEDMFVKKRNGKRESAPFLFIDLKFKDDTDLIGGRINRFDYPKIGVEIAEKLPIGEKLLVRAQFFRDQTGQLIRYAFVKKWRRLSDVKH